MPTWLIVLIVILSILVLLAALVFTLLPVKLWFRGVVSGAPVSMFRLIGMRLRRNRPHLILEAYINARKAGLKISIDELETHYMAGGDVLKVTNALISAHSAKIALTISTAKAIDLAGRDVLAAVKYSVTPRVIETPFISAIAMDGVEIKVKTRITVRVNIARLVGGAGEETIVARVGEGIVTTVGSAKTHSEVLQNPDSISKTVLHKGLDAGTAFEILSIDIADIDVGRNIGAELQMDQAEADKKIAQAKAEERRAMAIAAEQEMKARTQEMRAQVLLAESEVPKALAEAFRKGKMGVLDYYRMENMIADTEMRKKFGGDEGK